MATPVVAHNIRFRQVGAALWQFTQFPADQPITLTNLVRGIDYEIEAQSVGVNGRTSDWVPVQVTVATTVRTGSLALPAVAIGNTASIFADGMEASYTSTDTTATISVSAGTLVSGDAQVHYGPSSATITGTASEVRQVYLYYDDFSFAGGSRTLGVTTDRVITSSSAGRILLANITVRFAAEGGTQTGGRVIGGGGGGSGVVREVLE